MNNIVYITQSGHQNCALTKISQYPSWKISDSFQLKIEQG